MTSTIYGPWPAGSAGTVIILNGIATVADDITVHVFRGQVYYTVVKA